jgi:hypothetical protein
MRCRKHGRRCSALCLPAGKCNVPSIAQHQQRLWESVTRAKWKMKEAVVNLNETLKQIVNGTLNEE